MQSLNKLDHAILRTIAYAALFEYPLTRKQLRTYLIGMKASVHQIDAALKGMKSIESSGFFVVPKKFSEFIEKRRERRIESIHAFTQAGRVAYVLQLIPFIRCIAVSGSLAMANNTRMSDIDFFIITRKNTVWICRPMVWMMLHLLGKARYKDSRDSALRVCTNYWIDESKLRISLQNIYTAHEISQLIPLINKDHAYEKLLSANGWILNYLPHIPMPKRIPVKGPGILLVSWLAAVCVYPVNALFYLGQYLYMKKHMTCEKVSLHDAQFHPNDYSEAVPNAYSKLYRRLLVDEKRIRGKIRYVNGKFFTGISVSTITPGS